MVRVGPVAPNAWGRKLQVIYNFPHFVQKFHLFRIFRKKSFSGINALTRVIGAIIAKKVDQKFTKLLREMFYFRAIPPKTLKRWKVMLGQYAINLFLEVTFFLPNHRYAFFHHNTIEGFEYIEKALNEKQGVLVPSVHVGEFFHLISTLMVKTPIIDGKKELIHVAVIASLYNELLFTQFSKTYEHLHVVGTGDFETVEKQVKAHLDMNRVVIFFQDYSKRSNLRAPFIYDYEKTRYLYPAPQTLSHFHYKFGTPIVPAIVIPKRDISESVIKFFTRLIPGEPINHSSIVFSSDLLNRINQDINSVSTGIADQRMKYGVLSLKINHILNPYILKYPFYWEEMLNYLKRVQYSISLGKCTTYPELIFEVCGGLDTFIENSYEPGRKDKEIREKLLEIRLLVEKMAEDENILVVSMKNKIIEIGKITGKQAFQKVFGIILTYRTTKDPEVFDSLENSIAEIMELF